MDQMEMFGEPYVEHKGRRFPIKIHLEWRRDVTASIGKKSVNIRIPTYLGKKRRQRELEKMLAWVKEELTKNPNLLSPEEMPTYEDGQLLQVGRKTFKVHIKYLDRSGSRGKFLGHDLYLEVRKQLKEEVKQKHIRQLISRLVAEVFHPEVKARLDYWNQNFFKKDVKALYLKLNQSNWGSCSSEGNINISTRLLFAPDWVIDYVLVHELAHMVHMDHSKAYWAVVASVMPNYQQAEDWLDKHGPKVNF